MWNMRLKYILTFLKVLIPHNPRGANHRLLFEIDYCTLFGHDDIIGNLFSTISRQIMFLWGFKFQCGLMAQCK